MVSIASAMGKEIGLEILEEEIAIRADTNRSGNHLRYWFFAPFFRNTKKQRAQRMSGCPGFRVLSGKLEEFF